VAVSYEKGFDGNITQKRVFERFIGLEGGVYQKSGLRFTIYKNACVRAQSPELENVQAFVSAMPN
jgi:hypothetical protein